MRGVGQHHRGLGHVSFHAAPTHLPLQPANAASHLGTAFGLLELVAHVLLAHLEARLAALPFNEVINRRPTEQKPGGRQQQAVDIRAHLLKPSRRKRRDGQLTGNPLHREDRQQGRGEQRLAQPCRGAQRKKVFDVRDRIDAVKFESNSLGVNVEAAGLKDARAERRGSNGGHQDGRGTENRHGQAAQRNQCGFQLRGLPAGRRSQAARLVTPVLRCLFCALSGHRLSSQA